MLILRAEQICKTIKFTNKQRAKGGEQPITTLTKPDEFERLDLFEQNKKKAKDLQSQMKTIEQKIDAMVNDLYGLSEYEIRIMEGS